MVNGVFLVALCLSIFLEAIQRFVEPQDVSNPKLVLIVGSFGLASNILGLFLFHDHSHSHDGAGAHSREAKASNGIVAAEEGHNHSSVSKFSEIHSADASVEQSNSDDSPWNKSKARSTSNGDLTPQARSYNFMAVDEDNSTVADSTPSILSKKPAIAQPARKHRRHTSGSRSRFFSSADNINIHPASFRNEIIQASRLDGIESSVEDSEPDDPFMETNPDETNENSPLLRKHSSPRSPLRSRVLRKNDQASRHDSWHVSHKHNGSSGKENSEGHAHSDLNMRGVFIHVLGDALGNIGVIASALIIWLTQFSWRFYADPVISLIITVIILGSAIPLCLAASRILLQAVPAGISVDDIREDIEQLPGIASCHHLHVWQLSDTKLIASLHVQVDFDFKGEGAGGYMELARAVRRCLHAYGIHSSTIQPEFCLDTAHGYSEGTNKDNSSQSPTNTSIGHQGCNIRSKKPSRSGSPHSGEHPCLLDCMDDCGPSQQCCAPIGADDDGSHGHTH